MAQVSIVGTNLRVQISNFEALQALQTSFEIPLAKVRGATEDSNYISSGIGLRSPGTGFPGLIAKGTFRSPGQKILSLWRKGQQVVVIELADSRWHRLLIGCEDSSKLAALVNNAISDFQSPK